MTVLAAFILLAAAWPMAELWLQRPFRRTFPRLTLYLSGTLIGYVFVVAGLAWLTPTLTHVLALAALAMMIGQTWRARPNFGRHRGLPPGELKLLPVGAWLDVNYYAEEAQRHGPIFKSSHFLKPMVCIIGLEKGFDILRQNEDDALIPPEAAFARYIPCGYIRSMNAEDHKKYRPILQAAVSTEVNDLHAAQVHLTIAKHLGRVVATAQPGAAPRLTPCITEALYETLLLLFFGIAPNSKEQRAFREIYRILDASHGRRAAVWAPPDQKVQEALKETRQRLEGHIARFTMSSQPARSYLEAAWQFAGPEGVNEVVQLNLIYLLQVTCTDLTGLFDWILKKLSDNPHWQQTLRLTIDQHGFESEEASALGRRIVSETFRLEQSEHIYRKVVKPLRIGEFRIPKGWLLRICVRESHHCSPAFEDPETFNPDRFLNRSYGPFEYAPFGMFRRRCIGVDTGLALGGILAKTLVNGYDWQVIEPGSPEFRGWHWTPGSAFKVRLKPREGGGRLPAIP